MISDINCIETVRTCFRTLILPEELDALSPDGCPSMEAAPERGYKVCPTRHGCSGATNCDYSYGNYHR